ncbi:UNVERIFIED_CONTAM: signal transduction histidine kinase [Acetivibrio alkalicellulosi]
MDLYFDIKIFLQSISVFLSLIMIVFFVLKGKKTPLLYIYIFCQVIIFIWSTGHILVLFSTSVSFKFLAVCYEYIAISLVALAWLLFCLTYTFNSFLRKRKLIYLLFLPPLLVYLILITNNYHNMFYTQFDMESIVYGPLFWIHFIISYIYLISGTLLLIKHSISNIGYARKRTFFLILAVTIPIIANIVFIINTIFDIEYLPNDFDFTPVSLAFSLLLFSIAVFRYRFLNIVPIAFRKIVHNLNESIVVVDSLNRIDSFNQSFLNTFCGTDEIKIYDNINKFVKNLKSNVMLTPEAEKLIYAIKHEQSISESGEINIISPEKRSFRVNIQPLFGKKQEFLGRIILFNDITEYKKLLEELNEKNTELTAMNEQLSEYASTVEELSIIKERNRFARDVHDTLGHSMTLLISLLEVSSITCKKDVNETEKKLSEALNVAREGLKELRRSIKGLAPENLKNSDIISSIKKLVDDFKPSGVNIDFSYNVEKVNITSDVCSVIFRVCQEALTNSLRHGKAKNVNIILRYISDTIELFIFDDGIGCTDLKKGFGLSSMSQRVQDIGGNIVFGSDGESGFNIRMNLPLIDRYDSEIL